MEKTKQQYRELSDELSRYYLYADQTFGSDLQDALMALHYRNDRKFSQLYPGVPEALKNQLREFMIGLKYMESQYFESKPQRVIQLNEFAGAAVPTGEKHDQAAAILEKNGVKVKRYANTRGKKGLENRVKVVRAFKATLFARDKDRLGLHHKEATKRIPEIQEAVQALMDGRITQAQYSETVKRYKMVEPYDDVPEPASTEEMAGALSKDKLDRIGTPSEILPDTVEER